MTANLNPNLFRLSLPEWLKEQVESGKHKGVFWINEEERIFHVPWKHASRNGWEDDDVSLFKAWAIYTNRYREGVDKPKPALWKTNFRCAINSHNYITFMKDQGQRKGDKAHRIMKLIEQPKDCKGKVVDSCNNIEPLRKRVRITYPSSSDNSRKRVRSTYSNAMSKTNGASVKIEVCDNCRTEKIGTSECCGNCSSVNRVQYTTVLRNGDHEYLLNSDGQIFKENHCKITDNSELLKPKAELKTKKPNLQDLYFFGKALQSIDDPSIGLDILIKTNTQQLKSDMLSGKVKDEVGDTDILTHDTPTISYMGINENEYSYVGDTNIKKDNESDDNNDDDDDDELITPRAT